MDNGVQISDNVAAKAPPNIDFSSSPLDFSNNPVLINFLNIIGAKNTEKLLNNSNAGLTAAIVSGSSFVTNYFPLCGGSETYPTKLFFDNANAAGNGKVYLYGGTNCKSGVEATYQDLGNDAIQVRISSNEIVLTRKGPSAIAFESYSISSNGARSLIQNGNGWMPIQLTYDENILKNAYWSQQECRLPLAGANSIYLPTIQYIRSFDNPALYSGTSCPSGWTFMNTASKHRSPDLGSVGNTYGNLSTDYVSRIFKNNWDDIFVSSNVYAIAPDSITCDSFSSGSQSYMRALTLSASEYISAGLLCEKGAPYFSFIKGKFEGSPSYGINGKLNGLVIGPLILTINGSDKFSVHSNGTFNSPSKILVGDAYSVDVAVQPPGQTCAISGGSGVASANVTNMQIACTPNTKFLPKSIAKVCATPVQDQLLTLGDYKISTNSWGKGTITNFIDCIQGSTLGEIVQTGVSAIFDWSWPSENKGVRAYQEIIYAPLGATMPPIAFSDVGNLTLSHDVEIDAKGDYNLAYDIWVDSTPDLYQWPHKAEIMLKLSANWKDSPISKTLTIDGEAFDLIVKTMKNANGNEWKYISFNSKNPILKADIRLSHFIDYLVAESILPSSYYITGIEFGNEVATGATGPKGAVIKSYKVTR
jgi:hypothetical protein